MTIEEFNIHSDEQRKNVLIQTLRGLQSFSYAQIEWQKDQVASQLTGETVGGWAVAVRKHDGGMVTEESDTLEAALIPAIHLLDEANAEYWKQRRAARDAALAKLTPEDRKALNL